MANCTFCGNKMMRGTGKMFVYKDGRIAYFCSGKCHKNTIKLKRNPALTKWTKRYHDIKKGSGGKK